MDLVQAEVDVVKRFAESGPWSGTKAERKEKFRQLNADLAAVCGIAAPELVFPDDPALLRGTSIWTQYIADSNQIVWRGKLSVITYLSLFVMARVFLDPSWSGMSASTLNGWVRQMFQTCFPEKAGRLVDRGGILLSSNDPDLYGNELN